MTAADRLVNAVRSWVGTPYHHRAKVKGAGVDCIQLLVAAHEEAGLGSGVDTGKYSTDWHLHRSEELYLDGIEEHLRPVDELTLCIDARLLLDDTWRAPRASVFVLQIGRTFSYGGIVTDWPWVVHASQPAGIVEQVDILRIPNLRKRPMRLYIHEEIIA